MKKGIFVGLLSLLAGIFPISAEVDIFSVIDPSDRGEGYHTKLKLDPQRDDKILLSLPVVQKEAPKMLAWLVVCEKERKGGLNFRYQVDWFRCNASSADIEMVIPIKFGKDGMANLQLTRELVSRSYVVLGGHYRDGAFATVNLPTFLRAMEKDKLPAPRGI